MRSLNDTEEEVGDIMRDREIVCVVCLSLFSSCFIFCFFQSHPVDQSVQLEEKRSRQYQRVAAPQPPAIPVLVFTFLVCWGSPPRHRLLVRSC